MPTTEIVVAALVAGSKPGDPTNPAAAVLKEGGQTLSKTDGMQQLQFGMGVENENVLTMFINWDTIGHHHAFEKSEAYGPFLQGMGKVLDGPPTVFHADFKPDGALAKALSAPVTEVATFYFNGEPSNDYLEKAQQFLSSIQNGSVEGYLGSAVGTTYEEIEKDGVKGKGAVLAIGWSSVDAHMAFRETATFKENINLLRQGAEKISMVHTQFMNFIADQ